MREKRKYPTEAEDFLWNLLRTRPAGLKFRRQHSISTYIVDFYSVSARLAIEVDGSSHDGHEEDDAWRQGELESLGISLLRFTNEEVLYDTEAVLKQIEDWANDNQY